MGVRQDPANTNQLQLWFDGGGNPDMPPSTWNPLSGDTIVEYYVDPGSAALIRSHQTNNVTTSCAVAQNVANMSIAFISGNTVQITLTFSYIFPANFCPPITRQCTLIVNTSP